MYKKWQVHSGELLDSKNGFDVIKCDMCQFKHIVPIPTEKDLKQIYEDEYYTEDKPQYIEHMNKDLEWWNLTYDDRYDSFEEKLGEDRRTILDVGSGPGIFLKRGLERGWDVTGIEPSKQAFNYSSGTLGLNIHNMFLNHSSKKHLDHYDVIHLSEVLEHIPEPIELLKIVHEKLNPSGLICVVVPNDYNPFQLSLRDACKFDPWWLAPPHHINYFNPNSLEHLLNSIGFEIVLKESSFPIDMFLLMGDNYIGNDKLGSQCHNKRKTFELNLAKAGLNHLKRDYYQLISQLNIGREITIIAEKK